MSELARRCEDAEGPSRELDFLIALQIDWHWPDWEEGDALLSERVTKLGLEWVMWSDLWGRAVPKFSSSLDAAMTLVPEGINEWDVEVWPDSGVYPKHIRATAWVKGAARVYAATPALALCAAALRAGGEANG